MGQAVVVILCILGIGIGVFVGRLLARESVRKEYDTKLTEALRRAASAEASVPELRAQVKVKDADTHELQKRLEIEIAAKTVAQTALESERKRLEEQRAMLADAQDKLKDAFQAIAAQALNT